MGVSDLSTQEKIDILERELVELSGPLGRFVIKKQLKEMGMERDTLPLERLVELVERSVKNAVFNEEDQRKASGRIKKMITDA